MNDRKLVRWLLLILILPMALVMCSGEGDHFRYPCQNPSNWDKDICKMPLCDVTRTCPEHIFKGQRDPRLGPQADPVKPTTPTAPPASGACK